MRCVVMCYGVSGDSCFKEACPVHIHLSSFLFISPPSSKVLFYQFLLTFLAPEGKKYEVFKRKKKKKKEICACGNKREVFVHSQFNQTFFARCDK